MAQRQKSRKNSEGKQGTRTARGKRKGTGIWTETEKKSSGDTGKDTERAGHRKIDQDSGRTEMEEKLWMANRTNSNRNMGRELDKGIE